MDIVPIDTDELINDGNTDLEGIRQVGSRLVVDDQIDSWFWPILSFRLVNP